MKNLSDILLAMPKKTRSTWVIVDEDQLIIECNVTERGYWLTPSEIFVIRFFRGFNPLAEDTQKPEELDLTCCGYLPICFS